MLFKLLWSKTMKKNQLIKAMIMPLVLVCGGAIAAGTTYSKKVTTSASARLAMPNADLPPSANPGECYVKIVTPRERQVSSRVLKKAEKNNYETIPAQYREVTKKIMVSPALSQLECSEAETREVEERVMIKPAESKIEVVPAVYRTETTKILVTPARKEWKSSSQLTEEERRNNNLLAGSGDTMCLVETPAEYRDEERQVLVSPAVNKEVAVSEAQYKTITKTVLVSEPKCNKVQKPAEYKDITVQELVSPARVVEAKVPAEYETVTKTIADGSDTSWRQVLCEQNATPEVISKIQTVLGKTGVKTNTSGVLDNSTMDAVRKYQAANGLPIDPGSFINMDTIKALGVFVK